MSIADGGEWAEKSPKWLEESQIITNAAFQNVALLTGLVLSLDCLAPSEKFALFSAKTNFICSPPSVLATWMSVPESRREGLTRALCLRAFGDPAMSQMAERLAAGPPPPSQLPAGETPLGSHSRSPTERDGSPGPSESTLSISSDEMGRTLSERLVSKTIKKVTRDHHPVDVAGNSTE
ncbi:hypothetical protein T439DRAFT_329622 [Meredithblackwellia eburnea MCA 4105]